MSDMAAEMKIATMPPYRSTIVSHEVVRRGSGDAKRQRLAHLVRA